MLKGKGSLTIENFKDFNLDGNIDADLTSLQNFYLRGDVNSPLLHINKYAFDIHARDAGGRTGVEYKITRDGAHVLSGTSDFTTKTDKGRTLIEGKSTIKLTDGKSDDVTFKVIRNVYELARDDEVGFGGTVTINIGPRSYAGDLKLTDKEFHSKFSGCAKKGSCNNLEARSALQKNNVEGFSHNFEVLVDMRQVRFLKITIFWGFDYFCISPTDWLPPPIHPKIPNKSSWIQIQSQHRRRPSIQGQTRL